MFLACVGHLLRTVSLGDHYHAATGCLELVDVRESMRPAVVGPNEPDAIPSGFLAGPA